MGKEDLEYVIRLVTTEDIPLLEKMFKITKRSTGTAAIVETWHTVDPEGMFVACTEKDGIIGSCAGTALSRNHGCVGMFNVLPHHQGRGVGTSLLQAALHRLEERNVFLVTTGDLVPYFSRRICKLLVSDCSLFGFTCHMMFPLKTITDSSLKTWAIEGETLDKVVNYDKQLFGYDRTKIVKLSVGECNCFSRAVLDGDTVQGYGCIKSFIFEGSSTWLVGPLYAENRRTARLLLSAMLNYVVLETNNICALIPSVNKAAVDLMKEFGEVKLVYVGRRCFTKMIRNIPFEKIFAFSSGSFCTE